MRRAAEREPEMPPAAGSALSMRRAYLDLTGADAERLRRLQPLIEREADAIVEAFYDHLLSFDETRILLRDEEVQERLKRTQRAYLLEMFAGPYDTAYCRRKLEIGRAHYRIGLRPDLYLGAYHLYQRLLFPRVMAFLREAGEPDATILETLLSITKVMTLDMEYALEAYVEAYHEAILREKGHLQMLTARLREANNALNGLRHELESKVEERTSALLASQERLRRSERMAAIGQMASMMAHEIRNPLSSVVLNLELLADELENYRNVDTSEAQELVHSVLKQVQRMNETIRDYLAIARPPKVRLVPSNVNTVIEELAAFVQEEVRRANVSLHLSLSDELPTVQLDAEQFRHVLLNLVKNSLDAMPEGGELEIATDLDDGQVLISVHDTGVGIPEEHLEDVFQPLFTTKEKGLGMGLAFVREMVSAHDGEVTCESRPGAGTVFRIWLPAS